jgi:hypothetical protein
MRNVKEGRKGRRIIAKSKNRTREKNMKMKMKA